MFVPTPTRPASRRSDPPLPGAQAKPAITALDHPQILRKNQKYLRRQLLPAAREARRANAQSDKSQALRSLLNYLWSHRGRMGYRDRLRRGLPIGSGQIEGFCKSTLNRRLRLNNARWLPQSADHMAALCCLHTSKQWENFWSRVA